MSREFPDWVNPWKAAEGNRIYSGTIPLKRMERLKPLLADTDGEAGFQARFFRDGVGLTVIDLEVTAEMRLTCQASLEHFALAVDRRSQLAVIENVEDQEGLPGHYEAAWVESGQVIFLELVQDELILAIPPVPRKPGIASVKYTSGPIQDPEPGAVETGNPFASLAGLMGKERGKSDA